MNFTVLTLLLLLAMNPLAYSYTQQEFCDLAKTRKVATGKKFHRGIGKFAGCQSDTFWMKKTRDIFCQNTEPNKHRILEKLKIPKVFYFSFDGAADFNPEKALNSDPSILNLSGDEGDDLYIGNFNGGTKIISNIKKLSKGLSYEHRYYAGSGFHFEENYNSALRCARHIDEYLDFIESQNFGNYKNPLIVTTGYSNGGIDSIKLQNALPSLIQRSIDITLTIDPIEKAALYHPSKLFKNAGYKHPDTKIFLNYYQTIDHLSLGTYIDTAYLKKFYVGFKFRGKPVSGATVNHEFNLKNNEDFRFFDGAYAHVTILNSEKIWSDFSKSLKSIANEKIKTPVN